MASSNPTTPTRPWTNEEELKLCEGVYRFTHGLPPLKLLKWQWKDIPGYIGKVSYQGQENYRTELACKSHYGRNHEEFKAKYEAIFETNETNNIAVTSTQCYIPPRLLGAYEKYFQVKGNKAVLKANRRYQEENKDDIKPHIMEGLGRTRAPKKERTQADNQAICDAHFRMEGTGEHVWRWRDCLSWLIEHRGFEGTKLDTLKAWWNKNQGPEDIFAKLTPNPDATRDYTPPRLQHLRDPNQLEESSSEDEESLSDDEESLSDDEESSSDDEESSSDDKDKEAANALIGLSDVQIREMSEETQANLDEDHEDFVATGASLSDDPTNPAIALMRGPWGQPPVSFERSQPKEER
ncbi:hypothetical protein HYFRA_00005212 [Hymenoscyphus fraxineus]|uniref:Uncharacterized protein n=1 Tax=Hymenoscyphus fraxineus TaxID=746836 RepID=A0A9N9PPN4_9HELO|nr:hypothetical protein HYFRA_00005212 [Hymenoscyphus fraxineus]